MKAINVMLFLFIFNVVVSIVGGLHIYNMGMASEKYDYEQIEDSTTDFNSFFVGAGVVGALLGGATLGALISLASAGKLQTSTGVAYGFFISLMGVTFLNSYSILWTITESVPQELQGGVTIVVGIFIAITAVMFLIGLMQLIVGGVDQYT